MAEVRLRGEIDPGVWPEPVGFVEEVVAALGRDRDPRFADLDDDAVEEAVRVGAAEIAAATCRWLLVVAELVVRGIWARQGARSPAEWLSWAVSMAPSTAREHVRVALRLGEFPATTERFSKGQISYSKVRAITRLRIPELEETLLRFAEFATGAQLEEIVAGMRHVARAHTPTPDDQFERRACTWRWDEDGMLDLHVKLPPDLATDAVQRIDALVDRAFQRDRRTRHGAASAGSELEDASCGADAGASAGSPTDPDASAGSSDHDRDLDPVVEGGASSAGSAWRSVALSQRRADAFVEALRTAAQTDPDREHEVARETHTVVIHVDADALVAPPAGGDRAAAVRASAGSRLPVLSARAIRRLACDARLAVVAHDHDGEAAGISATTRKIPARLRRLLYARDRGCRFPSCTATRALHAHHILHWADGGPTELSNLVLLCAFHHRFVHDRDWAILHDGRGHLRFRPPTAPIIPTVAPAPEVDPLDAVERNRHHDIAPAPAALEPVAATPRADIDACVWVLCDRLSLLQPPATQEVAMAA